jgi:hypothetical protein
MKYWILTLSILFTISANAQENTLVIYVDPSASANKFALRNKLYSAIQDSEFNLILYISNGIKPLVSTNIYEAQKLIDQLDKLTPSKPNASFDLDSINNLLNKDSLASEIKMRTRELRENLVFYFFLDATQCRTEKQDVLIAEALLLSNRLMYKRGLINGVSAQMYFQNPSNSLDSAYLKNIANSSIFNIVRY